MENLNVKQIIKALECCAINHGTCNECIYQRMPTLTNCIVFNMQNAFQLLKELTEENERLHASCTELETLYKIECKRVDTVKSDTVREMREWLQERVKAIYLDEGELFELLNEYEKQISEDS